ncbi:MAG: ABC transporter ATP-binding protein [Candidatus Cloacimonetes bacterium]|nr:ABC transporter ATP-binding protein [Candidatus Cloacimonadota bacterium]
MNKMKILWNFMKGYRSLYIFSISSIGIATFIRFIWPLLLRITVDSVIGDKPLDVGGWLQPVFSGLFQQLGGRTSLIQCLWIFGLILVCLTLAQGLFLFFKGKLSAVASEAIVQRIRDKVYDHLQYLPFKYHVNARTGDLIQRCTSDVETIRRFLAVQLVEVGRALFMVGFALSFMLPMHLTMTLVSMALIPPIFIFAVIFFLKVKKAFQSSDESEGRMSTVLQENLTGVRVVRAFARQSYEIRKFDIRNCEYRDLTFRLIRLLAWYWSVSDFMSLLQIAVVMILGTYWSAIGMISLGTMLAFSSYVGMLLWPVRQMGRVLTDMGKALVSVDRIQQILNEPVEDSGTGNAQNYLQGNIEFRNVTFGYEHDKPVLKNISFRVSSGETIAILGRTGAGKSTLVHLLPRLYDVQEGAILIDGRDIREYDKKVLRKNIGIVLQEPFLFSKTLQENIGLAVENYTEADIRDAARAAAIDDVILNFEKGYDTLVGERGITLSGGQKQRIAIARAVIRNNPILIFDDSLSAVDTRTDATIRLELQKRPQRATTFIISHRLNTLAEADRILVLDNGMIVEQGSHLELLHKDGMYKRIWSIQNELEEELASEINDRNAELNVNNGKEIQIS